MGDSIFLLRSTIADMRKEGVVMVYGVDRTVPGERGSEVVIETPAGRRHIG